MQTNHEKAGHHVERLVLSNLILGLPWGADDLKLGV